MDSVKLDADLKKIEAQFAKFNEEVESLVKQRNTINQRLADIRDEQMRLQGDHRTLTALKSDGQKDKETGETVN